MNTDDLLFDMPEVDGWEVRLQATFIAPAPPPDPNLPATFEQEPGPRSNLVVNRVQTEEPDAMAAYGTFLSTTAGLVPGFAVVEAPAVFVFADGVEGVGAIVQFPATEQVTLAQLHVFRLDAHVLTQIVATVDAQEGAAALDDLRPRVRGFAPTGRRG